MFFYVITSEGKKEIQLEEGACGVGGFLRLGNLRGQV